MEKFKVKINTKEKIAYESDNGEIIELPITQAQLDELKKARPFDEAISVWEIIIGDVVLHEFRGLRHLIHYNYLAYLYGNLTDEQKEVVYAAIKEPDSCEFDNYGPPLGGYNVIHYAIRLTALYGECPNIRESAWENLYIKDVEYKIPDEYMLED